MANVVQEQGLKIRTIQGRLADESVYFIMNKTNSELAKKLDDALKIAKENGTLKEISMKFLGADRSK